MGQTKRGHGQGCVGFYDVWVKISHDFVVGFNTIDMSVWRFYSKYLWAPRIFVLQTILVDLCKSR